ncbi:CpaD family pilus assembly lipoprotein [Temperatibacter marinus]|uniref:CpaD family pilus assembly lipoprotein n=1 Tax=Temperatibacter marinus TaxID=1456591 RepID=A0AA52HAI9_9PROT|nr:CpaD family pilus assembly lipoprotein [Temperatibacter marinus]WND02648.1 CpaD family pilus assembly lipoprotein [Temperatibacter marinus]
MIKSIKLIAIVAAVYGTTACQETSPYTREGDLVKRSTVSMVRVSHDVLAEEDQTSTLSEKSKKELVKFLRETKVRYSDVALLDIGQDVDAQRQQDLMNFLKSKGVKVAGTGIFGKQPAYGGIKLYIERHIVQVPECGNWAESSHTSRTHNQATPNLGCATARNLGLMVANPQDLLRGEKSKRSNTKGAVDAVKGEGNQSSASSSSVPGLNL